ncbi:MAG TPA: type II toxin-antitoxin system RelE/ParE family toxin [Candidatus Anammoximicrobium sp.]|mgnify:CR=1 FL=1|nr:type II toxin-antitoxin system RelE/ParE family toxin [Candidatus Anammoximicrobium sp.]
MAAHVAARPRVWQDLAELAMHIGMDSPRAADRFLEAAQATFARLARNPLSVGRYFSRNPWLAGIRVARVRGVPNHLVFFFPSEAGIEVVRVLHGARHLEAALDDD